MAATVNPDTLNMFRAICKRAQLCSLFPNMPTLQSWLHFFINHLSLLEGGGMVEERLEPRTPLHFSVHCLQRASCIPGTVLSACHILVRQSDMDPNLIFQLSCSWKCSKKWAWMWYCIHFITPPFLPVPSPTSSRTP